MCEFGRARQTYPSRQYRHRYELGAALMAEEPLVAGRTYRFVMGRDPIPIELHAGDAGNPQDLFLIQVLLGAGPPPLSLRALRDRLDYIPALSTERSFVVADGGQIAWTPATDDLLRSFRLLVTREGIGAAQPDLLISASTNIDSEIAFLQVIAWDEAAGAFQFYDRRDRAWVWAGSSWDALAPDARGQGPFDSHVNGALNMKELKVPWIHWHSQASPILDSALAPDDPLRTEPLWIGRRLADEFEQTVARPGIERWTNARFARAIGGGTLTQLPAVMRQVLETTTINLVSSPVSSARLATVSAVQLPLTFFFNVDALVDVIGLEPSLERPMVPARVYREILARYQVGLTDGNHRIAGDTHFVFVVPEPAFEDTVILRKLISEGILSPKLAASLLMVDFPNAVFSRRRAALMRYVPAAAATRNPAAFEEGFIAAVRASPDAQNPASPEHELLDHWGLPDQTWRKTFEDRIAAFMAAVGSRLGTATSFAPIFELAESRRREFRKRKLAEFRLTTPVTNIPEDAPFWEFNSQGDVCRKP